METIGLAELRRRAVSAQGYASRFRRARGSELAAEVRRLSCVQLDSIATVDRSHRLVLGARVGAFPERRVTRLLASGRLLEYWAHEACLVPVEDYPLYRRRMRDRLHPWWGAVVDSDPALAERVLAEIRERGPLGARHFEGRNAGSWWDWKPAKRMLEALWTAGELAIAGRQGFQRLYDLTERVVPREQLEAPVPAEGDWLRALALRAVEARGVLTEAGIAEHWRLPGRTRTVRPAVEALVADGRLRRLAVEDGGAPVLVPAIGEPGSAAAPVLLSPFDNLLWDRAFVERAFGFRHVIEVYKPRHERVYGYYVLPFLRGDRLVGRADLKADRGEGVLRVKAFHREAGVRASAALAADLERALERLRRTLGLERVEPD